jgi:DNA-binding MarR family transcriptional regulator
MEYFMSDENESEIQDDYDYARARYYSLTEKGDEAIDLMLDLARESEHPRAFEVLSTMLKQNAEIADRLMELQKKKKEVRLTDNPQLPNSMTQNNVYVGSTTDLQRMLHNRINEKSTTIDQQTDSDDDDQDSEED